MRRQFNIGFQVALLAIIGLQTSPLRAKRARREVREGRRKLWRRRFHLGEEEEEEEEVLPRDKPRRIRM